MDGGQKRSGAFRIASGDTPPALEVQESVLDQVSQLIQVLIIRPLLLAISPWRDLHFHALPPGLLHDGVTVISLVG